MNKNEYYLDNQINFDAIKKRKYQKRTYFDPFNSIFTKKKIMPLNTIECKITNNVDEIKNEVKDDVNKINNEEIIEKNNKEISPNVSCKNII